MKVEILKTDDTYFLIHNDKIVVQKYLDYPKMSPLPREIIEAIEEIFEVNKD